MLYLLSYIYLGLPLAIFFLTWLRAPYSLLLSAALIIPFYFFYKDFCKEKKESLKILPIHFVLILITLAWIFFSGSGGFSFQNGDWIKHNAIFNDLIQLDWPVTYQLPDNTTVFLNYYLGWYMIPALAGKLYGLSGAFIVQFIWTTLGVVLSLVWLSKLIKKPHRLLYVMFIFFATADSLGIILLRNVNLLNFITPLEHWSTHEYSSFTTLLYWVPGQGIGIWIVMSILINLYKEKRPQDLLIWIALLMFWSPLGVIGMSPFISYMAYRQIKGGLKVNREIYLKNMSAIIILFFFYLFFSANIFASLYSKDFRGMWRADSVITWGRFGVFLFSESLLPLLLIFLSRKYLDETLKKFFYISIPILIFIPFFKYGLLNDLVMRGSIPALFVVFLCSATLLFSNKFRAQNKLLWLALAIYLIFGAITPITEINRSIQSEKNVGIPLTLPKIGDDLTVKQYIGKEDSFVAKNILSNEREYSRVSH